MLAYLYELVYGTHASKDGIVSDINVARYLGIIAEDTVITNKAIVSNMTVGHYQAIIAHLGGPPVLATPVNSYKFTNGGIVTDLYCCRFTFIFKILWYGGNYSAGKNAAAANDGNCIGGPTAL